MDFIKDVRKLAALPRATRYAKLRLFDYPFDLQLLTMSGLYRQSRKEYLALGGRFSPRISSTMRSLSAQDLFANEIDYTPSETELEWFAGNFDDVYDPENEVVALERFNSISVFHEQNHRILWKLLPPPGGDIVRYLNFAESLVVTLDLALGDELGRDLSEVFERMKVTYRTGGASAKARESYLEYLVSIQCATYFILEMMNPEDVLKAVNYVRPETKALNREAVKRSLDISELFTRVTNPQWQERSLASATSSLKKLHRGSRATALELPSDPLDLDDEFALVRFILREFGLR